MDKIKNDMIETLGIHNLPKEEQEEMYIQFGTVIYTEVLTRAMDMLEEKDLDVLNNLIKENPDPEALITFLSIKIPNLDEIIKEESAKIQNEAAMFISQVGQK